MLTKLADGILLREWANLEIVGAKNSISGALTVMVFKSTRKVTEFTEKMLLYHIMMFKIVAVIKHYSGGYFNLKNCFHRYLHCLPQYCWVLITVGINTYHRVHFFISAFSYFIASAPQS